MQTSYRAYNGYHCSSISCANITKQNNETIHNAICEVCKGECILMGEVGYNSAPR